MTFYFQFTYNLVSQSLFSWTQHNTGIEICILRNVYVSRSGISVCVTVIIQGHPFFFRCVLLNCLSFLKKFQQYMIQVFWTEEASGFFWRLKFKIFFSSKSKVRRSEVKHLQGTRGAQVPISKSLSFKKDVDDRIANTNVCTCVCILHKDPQCIRVYSFHLHLILLGLSYIIGEHGCKVVWHRWEDQSVRGESDGH